MCGRQKLETKKCSATVRAWFSIFFEKPFVSRVNRRECILTVRLARSMKDVLTAFSSGFPITHVLVVRRQIGGEYLRSPSGVVPYCFCSCAKSTSFQPKPLSTAARLYPPMMQAP